MIAVKSGFKFGREKAPTARGEVPRTVVSVSQGHFSVALKVGPW